MLYKMEHMTHCDKCAYSLMRLFGKFVRLVNTVTAQKRRRNNPVLCAVT